MADFPGDDLLDATWTLDREHVLPARAEQVWPWLEQLGKGRAGWYAPRWFERLTPARFHALRRIDPSLGVTVGDVVPDYGPSDFTVVVRRPPQALVFSGGHRGTTYTWALLLDDLDGGADGDPGRCVLHLRFRMTRAGRVARTLGAAVDRATVALLVAGLRERVRPAP